MNVMSAIAVPSAPTGFSAAEFWRMAQLGAFENMRVELVEGEFQRMPPPGRTHGTIQMGILAQLLTLVPHDRVFAEIAISVGDRTVLGPDAAIVKRAGGGDGPVAPEELLLIVEVAVSTSDRDLTMKRQLYAGAGVPTYWVVDAARRVVHVFDRQADGDYAGLSLVRFGETLAVPGTAGTVVVG